jgi:hypothetical protein
MLQDVLDKYEVSNFFAYHQLPRDKSTIEFGWIEVDEISLEDPIVISVRDDVSKNNATTLSDYQTYFNKLTSLTPNEFIEKWEPSIRELEVYWRGRYPQSDEDQYMFVLNVAYLVRDKNPFKMNGTSFEVFEVENEEGDQS